ncbi:MAG: cytochrome c [Pseudomonadota bacterium]
MRFATKILAASAAAVLAATAAQAQLKPEESLKMRQGLMQAVKFNFGPVGAFAQGKGDLPADAAARAENLSALARMAPAAWRKGTEGIEGNKTKDAAYGSADFAKGWEVMAAASDTLAAAAKGGDAAAIKAAAGEVGKTCKGCHDNFKQD